MSDFKIDATAKFPSLTATILANGRPVDLTGSTVTFTASKHGVKAISAAAATIVNAPLGIVRYDFTPSNLTNIGFYQAQFAVTFPAPASGTQYFPAEPYILECIAL